MEEIQYHLKEFIVRDHTKSLNEATEKLVLSYLKERYDMTLKELDKFIEKYEPERLL